MADLPVATRVDPNEPLWVIGWTDGSMPQSLDTKYPQSGDPYTVWTVRFTTRSGVEAFVEVPVERYTTNYVSATITDLAHDIEHVGALRGPAGGGH